MKLLLINKNPVVSRMMKMSVPKAGFEMEESEDIYNLPSGEYDVVVIDDEMYDENFWEVVKKSVQYKKAGLIKGSKGQDVEGFDFVLPKPFLPTDLIEILRTIKTEIELRQESLGHEPTEQGESIVEIEEEPEESPFISEPMEKSGILDESEVQQVAELLEDEEPLQESEDAIEKGIGEEEVQKGFEQEPQSVESQEEPMETEETKKEEGIDENIRKSEQEREMEAAVSMVESWPQESEEVQAAEMEEMAMGQEDVVQEDKIDENETSVNESKEDIVSEVPETTVQSATKSADILHEVSSLPLASLKELLDGMQLDITIKISFPDRRDV